jgi:hypothetical protein
VKRFGALGDIHGDFESARRIMMRHPDVPFWLCVGDVADAAGRYEPLPAPVHFIKGNNEGFDALASGDLPAQLHYLPNAVLRIIDGVRVAGIGGTLAPTWFDTPAADLPHPLGAHATPDGPGAGPARNAAGGAASGSGPSRKGQAVSAGKTVKDDKRRHFVREEVEACKALDRLDVLMTHEAPRPYVIGNASPAGGRGHDAGKTPVNEILASAKPRLHLFGHHHRFSEGDRQGVRSVGLDLVSKSFLLVNAATLTYEVVRL